MALASELALGLSSYLLTNQFSFALLGISLCFIYEIKVLAIDLASIVLGKEGHMGRETANKGQKTLGVVDPEILNISKALEILCKLLFVHFSGEGS